VERIENLVRLNNKFYGEPQLSLSLGVSTSEKRESLESAIRLADDNMYLNKREHHRRAGADD
jgi:GGDEF domain-containing protein